MRGGEISDLCVLSPEARDRKEPWVAILFNRELTPSQRSMRSRMAAYAMHAHHDGRNITSRARSAFLERFENQVDPTSSLPAAERQRRAAAAKKAYFTGLAFRSSRTRASRRAESSGEATS